MDQQTLRRLIGEKAEEVNRLLAHALPEEKGENAEVLRAMSYSTEAGGKRLRPLILLHVGDLYGADRKLTEPFAVALELIHTYSLVHDDLPAMDNDDLRRGKPTTHKVFGEGMAVLAGDGLLNYAYETALEAFRHANDQEGTDRVVQALEVLMKNAGVHGMIGGQCADLMAEKEEPASPADTVLYIHEHKTAAMMESAFQIGAILGGASAEDTENLKQIATDVGVAFQIRDDILDIEGDSTLLGKPVGSDIEEGKLTFPAVSGMEKAKAEVERRTDHALSLLGTLSVQDAFLQALIVSLTGREY
ncbi:MAG: polyprenyl synthetase family protein [Lachnospiraceae bacterium]|nr:polyprenyl synthetase family protein [Lachnospiraceae bacterium]